MKFAFISNNAVKDLYEWRLNKYRFHRQKLDFIKMGLVIFFLLFTAVIYFRFVSMSSTRWYFLRQANNELSSAEFSFEIYKTKVLDLQQENWEQMRWSTQEKNIIDITTQIVDVPEKKEISYNK